MSLGRNQPRQSAAWRGGVEPSRGGRTLVGICVASGCRAITAGLVRIEGRGRTASLVVEATETVRVDDELIGCYRRVSGGKPQTPGELGFLATGLADVAAQVTSRLLASTRLTEEPLLIGLHEPGLWHVGRDCPPACTPLCDPALLAEKTGLSVVDAFAARDLASGGLGGPILALPLWMLLADHAVPRILLDLGRTARLTYLPPRGFGAVDKVLSFDVGPGMVLPDTLAHQFTGGEYPFDPGGTLAVQGRRIVELIDHWLADPYFQRPPPRWYPLGVRSEAELQQSVHMAVEAGWTVRDLLCTATHFIAESIARAVRAWVPQLPPVRELILTGGGANNGFLLAEIARRLPDLKQCRAADVCDAGESLEVAAAACLAHLFLDQVPGNLSAVTGTSAPRVLGRLTPGAMGSWRAVLEQLATALERGGSGVMREAV